MAITGNGNASKEQVAKMLQQLVGFKELPKNLDSTDGLAAAVCHFFNTGRPELGKNIPHWDAFVKQNENGKKIILVNVCLKPIVLPRQLIYIKICQVFIFIFRL